MIKVQTTMFTAIAALTVDMGEAKSLSCIRLYPFWADGRVYGFKVEGSGDGKNWKMLVDKTENSICAGSAGFTLTYPGPRLSRRGP